MPEILSDAPISLLDSHLACLGLFYKSKNHPCDLLPFLVKLFKYEWPCVKLKVFNWDQLNNWAGFVFIKHLGSIICKYDPACNCKEYSPWNSINSLFGTRSEFSFLFLSSAIIISLGQTFYVGLKFFCSMQKKKKKTDKSE